MQLRKVLLSAVAGSVLAFAGAAHADVSGTTLPYYLADGTRTADYEAALKSWREDVQFGIDYSKGFLGLEHAYARGLSGRGLTIGVNDAGIHMDHPIFAAEGKIIGYDSGLPDYYGNNGKVNPRRPWESHGTHVAGTIAADRQDGFRMFGNAYNANIMSATANFVAGDFRWYGDYANGLSPNTGFENILGMAQTGQVRIINNSWGSANSIAHNAPRASVLANLTQDWGNLWDPIKEHDVLVIWSAGNSSGAHAGYTTTVPITDPSLRGNWLAVANYQASGLQSPSSSLCGQTATWCVAGPGHQIVSGVNSVEVDLDKAVDMYLGNFALRPMWTATTISALNNASVSIFVDKLNAYLTARDTMGAAFDEDDWVEDVAEAAAAISVIYAARTDNPDAYIATLSSLIYNNYDLLGSSFSDKLFVTADNLLQELYAEMLIIHGPMLGSMTGTSMAAPNISGFAGLLMEYFPEYNTSLISDILVSSSKDLDVAGVDLRSGWGAPQMGVALEGPTALRDIREVNVLAGTRDVWTNPISDARDRYSAEVLQYNANDIGGITKVGGGELVLTNVSNYTGATSVLGGLLTVNGALTHSDISVSNVGIIGGIGTLNNLTANSGGVVAPGDTANPYGVLKVTNDAVFKAGSYLWIRTGVNGAPNSRLDVGGKAIIEGGNVVLKANQGNWNLRSRLTILNAEGGVTGTFAGTSSDLAFLSPSLSYVGNSVVMTVKRNDVSIASAGTTANERSAGVALDAMTARNTTGNLALENAILDGSFSAIQGAIPQLTGEVHAALAGVATADSRYIRDAMLERGRGASGVIQPVDGKGLSFWASGVAAQADFDGTSEHAGFKADGSGYMVGIDKSIERAHFGVAFGEYKSKLENHNLSREADASSRHIGIYGGMNSGDFSLRAGGSWFDSDLSSNRNVSFNNFSEVLTSDYEGEGWQAYAEVAWNTQKGNTNIEPYANYSRVDFEADVFERGGDAALSGTARETADLLTAGVRTRTKLDLGSKAQAVNLIGHLAWTENFGDDAPVFSARFADGPAFDVAGQSLAGDALQTGLAVNIETGPRVALDIGYAGTYHSDYSNNRLFGRVTFKF